VLAIPPIVLAAPANVTVFDPPLNVPPLFVQFPTTVTLPARVTITPELICTLPKLIDAFGVMVDVLVNIALLPELSVRAVVLTVKFPPTLRPDPAAVVNTGLFEPPNVSPPLKLIAPVQVVESVPELSVNALLKVIVPVDDRLITSVAALALDAYVTEPITTNDPVVTAICATRDDVRSVPPMMTLPFTTAAPALMLHEVVTPVVG
jgi:hypothetical protein